ISASNEDPFKNQDLFRNDLFFRLAVINIKIPPLRERQEDILCLTNHFINIFNQRFSVSIEKIDEELQRILYIYNWPGNVRELKNILESTMIFVEENETILKFEHIPEYFREKMLNEKTIIKKNVTAQITLQEALDRLEKEMILQALEDNQWNISRSARQLGILRQNLQQKIKRHKIIRE
ncbi:MAG: helix-turn-helix domain-containing protein, partial [Clostridia bacterium]